MGAACLGAACGAGAWYTAVWARAYCATAFEPGDRFGLLFVWLPALVLGGCAYAAIGLGAGRMAACRFRRRVGALLPALLVVTVCVSLVWGVVAVVGTPAGRHGPPGVCPASNVPPAWPDWVPL